jgi:hypothetical protein
MGRALLVIGEPGTGKSRAGKNLDAKSTVWIQPNQKDLPFKGANKLYSKELKNRFTVKTFGEAFQFMNLVNTKAPHVKTIILDDLTHLFNQRVMADAGKTGFQKWMDLALATFDAIVKFEIDSRDDLTLIVVGHTATTSTQDGDSIIGLQTPGKLLDNNVKLDSYFSYVLHTIVQMEDNKPSYKFLTNWDGNRLAKSPEECLPLYIDNDYQLVLDAIKKYQDGE